LDTCGARVKSGARRKGALTQRLSTGAFWPRQIARKSTRRGPASRLAPAHLLPPYQPQAPPLAGSPLKRARREEREADQLATFPTVRRAALPEPRSEPATYHPDLIGELMTLASEGYSATETAAHWAISEETLTQWGEAHSDLSEALKLARTREKAWWTSRARVAISTDNNRFPAGAWSHVMRARFPEYDDKSGLSVTIDLGALVTIHRNQPEPLGERAAHSAKPLIDGHAVRLGDSLTGEGTGQSNLPDPDGGEMQSDGANPRPEGG